MAKRTFNITRADLGSYDGETVGWLILHGITAADLSTAMNYVSDVADDELTGGSYARGTIDLVVDQVGDQAVLTRDPLTTVPLADTSDSEDPTVVVLYDPTGGSDAARKLIFAGDVDEAPGFVDWPIDTSNGIAIVAEGTSGGSGGGGTTDDVTVPTGTMPNLEGGPFVPSGDTASDYLGGIDDAVSAAFGMALTAAGDAETAQAAADAAQADADTAQSAASSAGAAAATAGDDATEALDHLRSEALERLSTAPRFQVCTPWGGDHDTGAYTTDPPASFSGGFYWRGTVTAIGIPDAPASPSDGDLIYSELFTQTAEGIGNWDVFEVAVQWVYDAAAGAWLPTLFFEWTEVGGTSEAHSLATEGPSSAGGVTYPAWYFPRGIPTEVAVDLDFSNSDSKWDLSFWRRTYQGDPDSAFDGAEWVRISRAIGSTTTSIKTNSAYPWAFGMGSGEIELFDQSVRNGSSSGTVLASPTAADGLAAGDGQPFTDDQGNEWTPGVDAHVGVPSTGTGDVTGPSSSTDGHAVVFDGTTGKAIKSAGAAPVPTSRQLAGLDLSADRSAAALRSALGFTSVVTSADYSASSTTPVNITGAAVSYVNGDRLTITAEIRYTGDASNDARIGATFTNATVWLDVEGVDIAASSFPANRAVRGTIAASGDYGEVGAQNSSTAQRASVRGTLVATGSGTLQLTIAKRANSVSGTDTVAKTGSSFRAEASS